MPEYTCCGRGFTSFNGYRNHLDNASAHAYEIECGWCNRRWPDNMTNARRQHEQSVHWLACDECDCIFEYQDGLEEHVEDEHPPNYCYPCQRRFANANNLRTHLNSHIHKGHNVKCPWCDRRFVNYTGVCLHLESGNCTSGINESKITTYCRQVDPNHVFTKKQIGWYDTHSDDDTPRIASDASWDGRWFRCYLCDKGFPRLNSLNQHLASPTHRQKIYHCPRCPTEFSTLSGLINHLELETCGQFRFQQGSQGGFSFMTQLKLGAA